MNHLSLPHQEPRRPDDRQTGNNAKNQDCVRIADHPIHGTHFKRVRCRKSMGSRDLADPWTISIHGPVRGTVPASAPGAAGMDGTFQPSFTSPSSSQGSSACVYLVVWLHCMAVWICILIARLATIRFANVNGRSTAMAAAGPAERSRCDHHVPNRAKVPWRPEWRQ